MGWHLKRAISFSVILAIAGACSMQTTYAQTDSLWSASVAPTNVDEPDNNSVELGVKFFSDVAGSVYSIRFYKGPLNTGTHTVHLWSSAGKMLASATSSNETATGWQTVNFSSPIAITAGQTYTASYHTPGEYADDIHYFTDEYSNGVLHAPVNAGVYQYGRKSAFPSSVWESSNYWVDVIFVSSSQQSPPPTAMNGECGSASGVPTSSKPTTGLCTDGTATPVSGSGPWTWMCTGSNGGTTASCSATVQTTNHGGCPYSAAGYQDGCGNAPTPAGSIQYPNLLQKYGNNRPRWNVAGVDYYVGMPAGITLTPWQSIASPGVSLDTTNGILYCNSGAVTLDEIDFSANGGSFQYIYAPPGGCTSLTITNSKFGCPSTGSYHLIYLNTPVNFTLKYNTMDWTGCESSGWQGGNQDTLLISNGPAGSTGVIQYNYIAHTANHPFSVAGVSSYDFRYNFLDNVAYDNKVGNHMNYMQMFGNNSNVTWAYNTTYQSATCCETGGEGTQFYSNGGGTLTNAIFANNTMVATGGNMSYMAHGSVGGSTTLNGTATNSQNYFDPTGTTDGNSNGIYYPGSMVAPWVSSGNIDMVTGAGVTPQ